MIKADKTATLIEGSNLEVATQFLHIMDAMIEHEPEKVIAYLDVRKEKIEEAIKSADIKEICFSEHAYKSVSTVERMSDNDEA